jgi:hydroxyethylthiazole kinase
MSWQYLQSIRQTAPLVLNITNYVVMNNTANALLAVGASPVMAHAIEEIEDMAGLASALVINIGTLSSPWIESMIKAGKVARQRRIPVILDPVGCGATAFRTTTAKRLIDEVGPAIIRGNASEIRSLVDQGGRTKGVDSLQTPAEIIDDAVALAKSVGCVVSVSGPEDLIVDGARMAHVANGHPMMTRVTGMGCTASAITGAFSAVTPSAFEAGVAAMTIMGIAGEIAAEKSPGPGSLQVNFLDALYSLKEDDILARSRVRTD